MCQQDPWTYISKAQHSSSFRRRLTLLTTDCFLEREKKDCLVFCGFIHQFTAVRINQFIAQIEEENCCKEADGKAFLFARRRKWRGLIQADHGVSLLLAGVTAVSCSKWCTSSHHTQDPNKHTQSKQRLLHCAGWILPPDTPPFFLRSHSLNLTPELH